MRSTRYRSGKAPWPYRALGLLVLPAMLAVLAPRAEAQRSGYSYLSYAGQDVVLISQGEDDNEAQASMPILAGDRLETGASSRAEAVLASGNVLRFDVRTYVRFEGMSSTYESEDTRDLLFLERGGLFVDVREDEPVGQAIRIDTEDATVVLPRRGRVRIDAGRRGTEIYVLSGRAEVAARSGRVRLSPGEYAFVSGESEIETDSATAPRDRFARFVDERLDRVERANSHRYVDDDYAYDVSSLDEHGSWVYVNEVSRWCWRPTVSAADWRPYTRGYWRWTPAGLTWVSYDPWGWHTWHYGTWAYASVHGWYWVPGSVYSPAWVYWAYTPAYVGWCPWGYYGYYDTYYRHVRNIWGGGGHHNPYLHLSGRVQLHTIDGRGWSFTSVGHLGRRFGTRDVVRLDSIRRGEHALIESAPLRIPNRESIVESIRRVPELGPRLPQGSSTGLESILRRDPVSSSGSVLDGEIRRSVTRIDDPVTRPIPVDSVGRRTTETGGTRGGGSAGTTPIEGDRTGLSTGTTRGTGGTQGRVGDPGRTTTTSEGWRHGEGSGTSVSPGSSTTGPSSGSSGSWRTTEVTPRGGATEAGPSRSTDRGTGSVEAPPGRRGESSPGASSSGPGSAWRETPRPGRIESRGWEAPRSTESRSGETRAAPPPQPSRPSEAPRATESPRSEAPRQSETPRRGETPRTSETPRSDPPRTEPRRRENLSAWRTFDSSSPVRDSSGTPSSTWRRSEEGSSAPHRTEVRRESYTAPRSYEPPRSYEAPRSYQAPRSYEAPRTETRSYAAPRPESARSYESPRAQPPSPSHQEPSRGSSASSTSSSSRTSEAPRRPD